MAEVFSSEILPSYIIALLICMSAEAVHADASKELCKCQKTRVLL